MRRIGIFCVLSLLVVAAVGRAAPLTRPSGSVSMVGLRLGIAGLSSSATSRGPSIQEARRRSVGADRVVGARSRIARNTVLLGNHMIRRMVGRITPGRAEAFPFAVRRAGRVSRISVYVDPHNRAKELIVGLYSNRPGGPLRRLASGTRASLKAGSWNAVRVTSATVRSRRTYWIAVLGRGGMLYFRDHKVGSCEGEMSRGFSLGSVPSLWANGTRRNACPISAYATGRPNTTAASGTPTLGTLAPTPPAGTHPVSAPASTVGDSPTTPANPTPAFPVNTGAPAITGNPVDGQTLTTTTGSWIDGPTSYAYQWRACDTLGLVCTDIDNATSSSYVLTSADVGHKLRSVVTASNADGSAAATSTQTPVVSVPPPPTNTALPKISGTPSFGNTLTASIGSWTNSPTSYAYQWQDCSGGRCPGIPGATSSSYTLQSSYAGDTIDVVVTATNAGGSSPATSAQTAAVTGSSSGCPSSTPNTPDGADPWGSCFPGPQTSGVPGNVTLVNVSSGIQPPNAALPSDNTGWTNSGGTIRLTSANAVVDGISTSGGLNVLSGSGGLVKDSHSQTT